MSEGCFQPTGMVLVAKAVLAKAGPSAGGAVDANTTGGANEKVTGTEYPTSHSRKAVLGNGFGGVAAIIVVLA